MLPSSTFTAVSPQRDSTAMTSDWASLPRVRARALTAAEEDGLEVPADATLRAQPADAYAQAGGALTVRLLLTPHLS